MNGYSIEATGLTKRYGDVEALAGLDLVAPRGQVLAVLGPNGAGKTTFVRSIATLIEPDAGTLRVAGIDVREQPGQVRRIIGLAGQYAAVEPALTGRENLQLVARLYGHDRRQAAANSAEVLAQLGLEDAGDRRVGTYSGGMRRRLDLGATLVGAPQLLLLDEPTTGLDPHSRDELWQAIRRLVDAGTDVLLTTQYLEEADQLASQVVIIGAGRVLAEGTPDQLKRRAGRDLIEVAARDAGELPLVAAALGPIGLAQPRLDVATRRVTVPVEGSRAAMSAAVRALEAADLDVEDLALRRPTLDEVFLAITGAPATTATDDAVVAPAA